MPLPKSTLVAALAALYFGPGLLFFYVASGADEPSASAVLTSPGEPGEPLRITGTVYRPDGETPAAGVDLYVFHTDNQGLYSETNDNTNPRLEATVRTGADGRYELSTIKPAPYPGGGIPAHVHYHISGGGFPEQAVELNFEGDPELSARVEERSAGRGRFGSVRRLEKGAGGGWQVVFDLKLRD